MGIGSFADKKNMIDYWPAGTPGPARLCVPVREVYSYTYVRWYDDPEASAYIPCVIA
jgi:hypothetical protein